MRPRIIMKRPNYMNKVVDLYDLNGNFLFRGTRRECVRFSRETFEERMTQKRAIYGLMS
jgi:hypothetical protein